MLEPCWYVTRIGCCVRRIFSQGEDSHRSQFPGEWGRKRFDVLIIILGGSASLERKNKLQGPKREFPPVPRDHGDRWTVSHMWLGGFVEERGLQEGPWDSWCRTQGTQNMNAGHLRLVKTKPRLAPPVSWGTWSCRVSFSIAEKSTFRKRNRSHFSSMWHDLTLVGTGPGRMAAGPQAWDGAPRWMDGGVRVCNLTLCTWNYVSSLLF